MLPQGLYTVSIKLHIRAKKDINVSSNNIFGDTSTLILDRETQLAPSTRNTFPIKKKKIVIYPKHSPISINSFHLFSCVRLCATPGTAAHQDSLSITNFQSLLKFKSIESSMPSKHLILSYTLLIGLHSFLASGSFPMRQFFASGGQSTGVAASVSVLLVNNQD